MTTEMNASVNPGNRIICVKELTFSNVLTKGTEYVILEIDKEREQVKIKGDDERRHWFPIVCFNLLGKDGHVPLLTEVIIQSEIIESLESSIEVVVKLSDNQVRWCFFVTPHILLTMNQFQSEDGIVNMYGAPHMIVVNKMSREIIQQALKFIDSQGELESCTIPIDSAYR